ncbi:MAG: phosphoenolpyruvate carboxykinase domain-containing protein [Patescibacteria group bacterium]|nr:phosphoenolpyruvate carboxykinase domain-containing protein [Patescibacteria group bacterium]
MKKLPIIFGVNYFLRDEKGKFLNDILDKKIWIKWMELRIHKEVEAIKTPTGQIPKYEDLCLLFKKILGKDYKKKDYLKQFTLRIPENLAKLERVERFYRQKVADAPVILFKLLKEQRKRLLKAKEKFGPYILPENFL